MYSKTILVGRVGKDAVLRNEKAPVSFGFATWESYKDNDGEWQTTTTWNDVICWGTPEYKKYLMGFVKKGAVLLVEGKIVTNEWEDSDGNKRQSKRVQASMVKAIPSGTNVQKVVDDLSSDDEDLDEGLEEDDSDDLPF